LFRFFHTPSRKSNFADRPELAGPTDREGVGTFLESVASKSGTSKKQVADQFFAAARPSSTAG